MPRSTRSPSVEIQHVQPVAGNKRRRPSTATASPRPGSRRSTRRATAAAAPPPTTIILDSSDTDELFVSRPTKHLRVDSETDEDPFPNDHPQRDVAAAKPPSPVVAPAPEPAAAAKNANRIEFAAFQCAICMDNATNLAVTHCGHMFCSECLQSALTTETTRNKCPICRQKVETRERDTYNAKTKGFWHLELKPMTANKKGKQAAK
ncbi:putative SLX8 protein [Plectosphaerella plurivora]|uniref:SLX8 protein n=1 Tax=Plectosphaerella plurivora TaxID=936078 RepID=A0A9P8VJ84_9PEZI|nr:putative SLX8 protein [Plectosphaerella plurivora]